MATQRLSLGGDNQPERDGLAARIERLEAELDDALNQARMLRAQLRAAAGAAASVAPDPAREIPPGKRRLHATLDRLQAATPAFLRSLTRRFYLKYFYYRLFPEHAPPAAGRAAALPPPALYPLEDGLAAHSGYAPFVRFKQLLARDLNMNLAGVRTECRPGLVSVVLPVYNGARYLEQAIDSVLGQSYRDFELIVVDDGSEDETPEILARYAGEPRMRVIRQANRKLPAALNAGFEGASGEFFTWISADNLMRPEMLAELAGFLERQADVEMVYADEELIDERGHPALGTDFCPAYQSPPGSNRLRRPRDPGELNFVQNNYIGACFMYRAWAARCAGPYSPLRFGFEDYDFWMRMNALFRAAHYGEPRPLYCYRLHPDSLTANQKEHRITERVRYFMAVEAERREFFLEPFDVTFAGAHPWFSALAAAYRRSGNNVMRIEQLGAEALYRYGATRAFRKAVVIGSGETELNAAIVLEGGRARFPDFTLTAGSAAALEYPLLAAANGMLWNRREADCRASR